MTTKRILPISVLEEFKSNFKQFVEENIKLLEYPVIIQANKVKMGDVLSFKNTFSHRKMKSRNPYICFEDGYMSSQNQTFKNHSSQELVKYGTIELSDRQIEIFENLLIYHNN
jgi:hypothetical protein